MALIQRNGDAFAYEAGGEIRPYRLIQFGSNDSTVVQASAAADLIIGVSYIPNAHEDAYQINQPIPEIKLIAGDTVDVVMNGFPRVEYGGTVTRGQALTSDANGRAIAATAGDQVAGYAGVSAVVGDIGPIMWGRSVL